MRLKDFSALKTEKNCSFEWDLRGYCRAAKAHREPQWQKSEDIEKKLFGSSIYFANKRPYVASVSGGQAPIIMGTIFTLVLQVHPQKKISNVSPNAFHKAIETKSIKSSHHVTCANWHFTYPWKTFARKGKCISMLCSASSTLMDISSNLPLARSSS